MWNLLWNNINVFWIKSLFPQFLQQKSVNALSPLRKNAKHMILSQITEAVKFYLTLPKTSKLTFYWKLSQPALQKWDF